MMKYVLVLLFVHISGIIGLSQSYVTYETYDEMEEGLLTNLDPHKTYIINYWATWCKPCVEELPLFEAITNQNNSDIKVVLVSLDFPKQIEKKFKPFLEKRDLQSEVVLLLDGKYNNWIDKIDSTWSGAIPATLYIRGDKRYFHEGQYDSTEEIYLDAKKVKKQ